MLITLCYVYMWVRFHKCYTVLIRQGLSRLNSGKRFSFSILPCSASAQATTSGRRAAAHGQSPPQTEDVVFLHLGDKAVCVTEPQVCCLIQCLPLLRQSYVIHLCVWVESSRLPDLLEYLWSHNAELRSEVQRFRFLIKGKTLLALLSDWIFQLLPVRHLKVPVKYVYTPLYTY